MDVDPVYPGEAFGDPEGIDPTNCFGPYAQGGLVVVLPTTTPSRPTSGSMGDSGSRINTFLNCVSDMRQIMMNLANSPSRLKGNGKKLVEERSGLHFPFLVIKKRFTD